MSNFITNLIMKINEHSSSFLSSNTTTYFITLIENLFSSIGNIFSKLLWTISTFLMLIMDIFEYISYSLIQAN